MVVNNVRRYYGNNTSESLKERLKSQELIAYLHFSMISYHAQEYVERKLGKLGAKFVSIYRYGDSCSYVAEFDDFVLVSFKGMENEGLKHLKTGFTFWKSEYLGEFVHTGFMEVIDHVGERIECDLKRILDKGKKEVIYTGHSLGGALSLLMCMIRQPDRIITFGSPKVAGTGFECKLQGVDITRVYTKSDIVSQMPPDIPRLLDYKHFGKEVVLEGTRHPIKTHRLRSYMMELWWYYKGGK